MKRPIITGEQRHSMAMPELEIAKLRFKREIERTQYVQWVKRVVEWLAKVLT